MAYYDRIARQYHRFSGRQGGLFKELVLNDAILSRIEGVGGRSILELGAGTGYFMPLVLRRFSGQAPRRLVITDQSSRMLSLARRHFPIPDAEYRVLDVREPFPLEAGAFDLVLATMVFNEVPTPGLRRALAECARVLRPDGRLLAAVLHPRFLLSLERRGMIRSSGGGLSTMTAAGGLQLPVAARRPGTYERLLEAAGLEQCSEDLFSTEAVRRARPGLRHAGHVPVAQIFDCRRITDCQR